MSIKPLVSVIIIFLNEKRFIEEAFESVFAQSYDHWELLLVDDGSTDGSTEIARRYADRHPEKVRYLEHPEHQNRGMSASRNLGIAQARGDYIGFLDADDLWLPHKLEQQVAIMEAHPEAAMVYGRTMIWHSWTKHPEDADRDQFYELGVRPNMVVKPPKLFFLLLENKAQTPTTCNAMMRRSVFEEVGGFEESFRGLYEDQVFFAKIELELSVYVADACWAKYRQHAGSCSITAEGVQTYYETRLPFLMWLKHYLAEHKLGTDNQTQKMLKRELWRCTHPYLDQMLSLSWWVLARVQEIFKVKKRNARNKVE